MRINKERSEYGLPYEETRLCFKRQRTRRTLWVLGGFMPLIRSEKEKRTPLQCPHGADYGRSDADNWVLSASSRMRRNKERSKQGLPLRRCATMFQEATNTQNLLGSWVANINPNRTRLKRWKSTLFLENSLAKSALCFVPFQKISLNFDRFR